MRSTMGFNDLQWFFKRRASVIFKHSEMYEDISDAKLSTTNGIRDPDSLAQHHLCTNPRLQNSRGSFCIMLGRDFCQTKRQYKKCVGLKTVYMVPYIYMWQGPFGIMRPSSLSPHIVLLFFLWLLSLSLFLFLFLFFFLSLSLSLSFLLFFSLRAFLGIRFSSSPICVPTCLPCSLQFVSLIPSPLLFFSFLLLGCFLYLSLNCCARLCALWDETYCPLHSPILGLCFLLSFLFPFFPYLFIYSFPVLSSPSLQLLSLGAVRTQDSPCLPCVPICVLIQPIFSLFLLHFTFLLILLSPLLFLSRL